MPRISSTPPAASANASTKKTVKRPGLARIIAAPACYRVACAQNQTEFWQRFGCTQSGGSRYESGRDLPEPVQLLLALEVMGVIGPDDLARAHARLARARRV